MIALLLPHTGAHVAPHAAVLPVLPAIFRRAVAAVRRKPAVPADLGAAGTATPTALPGPREHDWLTDLELASLSARRAKQHADAMHTGYARAVDRLRRDAGLPTVDEMRDEYFGLPKRRREPGKPPWWTTEQPAYGQACQLKVAPELAERRAS